MDLRRTHEALTSFAVSAVLTSAFLASAPNEANAAVAAPQSVAAAQVASVSEPILTADQQKVLVKLMVTYGHDAAFSSAVTVALGISKGNKVLTLRQLVVDEHPLLHAYIPLPDGGVMLGFFDGVAYWNYRLDPRLKLLAAVSIRAGQASVVIPMPDAERNVRTELVYWGAVADRHATDR